MTTTINNLSYKNIKFEIKYSKFNITLKAGTGKRIVEFDILAIYWYNGKLLCAALKT